MSDVCAVGTWRSLVLTRTTVAVQQGRGRRRAGPDAQSEAPARRCAPRPPAMLGHPARGKTRCAPSSLRSNSCRESDHEARWRARPGVLRFSGASHSHPALPTAALVLAGGTEDHHRQGPSQVACALATMPPYYRGGSTHLRMLRRCPSRCGAAAPQRLSRLRPHAAPSGCARMPATHCQPMLRTTSLDARTTSLDARTP